MRKLFTLLCSASATLVFAQCTVVDLPFDSLSVRWTHGFADAQGGIWGVATAMDGSKDLFAMHLDAAGNSIWTKRYSKLNPQMGLFPMQLVPTAGGGMLILGNHSAWFHENFFGLELDANGQILWGRLFMEPYGAWDGYDFNPSITELPGGGYQLILATANGINAVRLGTDGVILWHKRYHLTTGLYGYDVGPVLLTDDGGLVHTALIYPQPDSAARCLVLRTDMQGGIEWFHVYDQPFRPRSIAQTANGDLLIGGRMCDTINGCRSDLARFSSSGNFLWATRYDALGQVGSIAELQNGDLVLGMEGEHATLYPVDVPDLVRTTANGDPIAAFDWDQDEPAPYAGGWSYLADLSDHGTTLMARNDGSIITTGNVHASNTGPFKPRLLFLDQTTDPACSMTSMSLGATQVDATEVSSAMDVDSDVVRTWPMALTDPIDQSQIELSTSLNNGWARPGFDFGYYCSLMNWGGTASGPVTCTLTFDPSLSVVSTDPANGTVSGNTITWTGAPVGGNHNAGYSAILHVPTSAVIGTSLSATFSVQQDSTEYTLDNNSSDLTHTIVGSYDPNDKSVSPADFYVLGTDSVLDYTIRFQNTGTFLATTVVLRDTLPLEVDPTSFRPGAVSHPYTYSLTANGILEVRFDNINLPDSNANEALSHGLFSFSIKPNTPLLAGTTIANRADIFFDFNPPIRTPDATVVVTEETGIVPKTTPEQLHVFPTPVTHTLNAIAPAGFEPVAAWAFGVDGRPTQLFKPANAAQANTFDVRRLACGGYVLTLVDRQGRRLSTRFVKE